ncbi:hypothetical protein VTK73DRAFT_2297 [Phialemonium thermophilum]|uniref:Uncharacterized protein n=1 Tax=Phialemonium thermophilum TaxID=223376 RepID=A0ABR3VSD0_9PEZI
MHRFPCRRLARSWLRNPQRRSQRVPPSATALMSPPNPRLARRSRRCGKLTLARGVSVLTGKEPPSRLTRVVQLLTAMSCCPPSASASSSARWTSSSPWPPMPRSAATSTP